MAFIHERQNKKSKTYYVHYYHNGKLYREKVGKNKEAAQMRLGDVILGAGHSAQLRWKDLPCWSPNLYAKGFSFSFYHR